MRLLLFFQLFIFQLGIAQTPIQVNFVKKTPVDIDLLVNVDNFGTLFYVKNNVLHKKNTQNDYTYSNLQLANITSANAFNPLKINLFYKDMNTLVILDNRLAEIFKVDFNRISTYRNASHVSTGNDNTVWLYNQDTNQLEVYNYLNNKTRVTTLPIVDTVIDLKSNFNFCWLLTEKHLYCYNYAGSLILKLPNSGFNELSENDENIILKKDNTLYYLKKNSKEILPLKTPELLIKQFLMTDETVYIYDGEFLHQYQIKTN